MPSIHLIIPDNALREAVAEQLALAKLGTSGQSDVAAAAADAETAAIIIDATTLDKKALKILTATGADKKCILVLGTLTDEAVEKIATESFPKPLRLGHLLARLDFHLNTAPRLRGRPVVFGPFRLESQNRQLVVIETGATVRLTEKETALLDYLTQSTEPITREDILASIWGYDARIDTHTLETHIYQLRRKLDTEGKGLEILVNEQGAYRLNMS